jgi:DNA (cytosine-5)-methyltransferase 1
MITFGSLFSGIGGFDLAFENAGMDCLWQCEIDEKARSVLKKHFDKEIYTDVRTISRKNTKPVDLICGGFPCQDLSVAGKRKGLAGERSGLWFEFARIIDQLEPRWAVIENVPGLLSSGEGKDFEIIIRWLAERGYGVAWRVLDAQYFGVPQRRRRVFIVASFGSGNCAKVLFESESLQGDYPESQKAGQGVAFTLRTNTSSSSCKGDGGVNTTQVNDVISPTICAETGSRSLRYGSDTMITDTLTTNGDSHSGFRDGEGIVIGSLTGGVHPGGFNGQDVGNIISTPITTDPYSDNDGEESKLVWDFHRQDGSYRPQSNTSPSVCAKLGTGGNNMPFVGVRRLTPLECERLQGFHDNWTAGQSDAARYKQCGNAVAVPVVQWIGRRIVEVDI